ncbi:MAG: ergothioneine biosynthesis protein EgtB, partial [Gammaproteobacteria bacterium]|nr:ergothioneine biosynthesis protein EgtB [Gammaproteobacteria bacterium]
KSPPDLKFILTKAGTYKIGFDGGDFCFDNETPAHDVLLHPHALASRLVTNAEYREFIEDGGYTKAELWLSDGWATVLAENWNRPLYWSEDLSKEFTLNGSREINPNEPVCHVSFFEADAFARWAGARLPTEAEWEHMASAHETSGNLLEQELFHPSAASTSAADEAFLQVYGDVWEWTSSPYIPYPGYRPPPGAVGEYNGKFMCNQWVLRGGSCVTSTSHIRATYRNFFYPHNRWQFTGIRLAKDS